MRLLNEDDVIKTVTMALTAEPQKGAYSNTRKAQEMVKQIPTAEPQLIRCKDCKYLESTKRKRKSFYYCCQWDELGNDVRLNDFCSKAEREETTPSRQDVEEKYCTWHRILQAYHDPANGLSYKVVDLQCPVCKEWLGSAEPVEECPNCGTKMETEEKNDNRRLCGDGNMEPFEEKEKEEEKG